MPNYDHWRFETGNAELMEAFIKATERIVREDDCDYIMSRISTVNERNNAQMELIVTALSHAFPNEAITVEVTPQGEGYEHTYTYMYVDGNPTPLQRYGEPPENNSKGKAPEPTYKIPIPLMPRKNDREYPF